VHWGIASHYTRGVSIVDEGLRRLWEEAERLPAYRENTVFVVVPDCGRDHNPFVAVPFQHHFNAHHIFAAVAGPGIDRGRVVDRVVDQAEVAATVAAVMGFPMPLADGKVLGEVFA
jgi:phosphoglycerol transferase MdoB-like AlkP superfamily enzyme